MNTRMLCSILFLLSFSILKAQNGNDTFYCDAHIYVVDSNWSFADHYSDIEAYTIYYRDKAGVQMSMSCDLNFKVDFDSVIVKDTIKHDALSVVRFRISYKGSKHSVLYASYLNLQILMKVDAGLPEERYLKRIYKIFDTRKK